MAVMLDTSLGSPPLAEAIDRQPLIVTPETYLQDAIALMHHTAQSSHPSPPLTDTLQGARSSCVLVMRDEELLGIFTERDVVQSAALGIDLQRTQIYEVMHYPVLTVAESLLNDIFAASFLFRRHRVRHLVVVRQQTLVGVISLDSIRQILRPANLLKIRRVAEVMSRQVVTALPEASVATVTEMMANHRISCIVIVQPAEEDDSVQYPVGIVTERDIVRFQSLGLDLHHTPVQMVMSTPIFLLNPEDSLWTAHQEMERRQVRRLVVSWNWGRSLALITQTCILRVFDPIEMQGVIETLQRTIQELGFDLDQVLANTINHDTQLPASACSLREDEIPNLKTFIDKLQIEVEHLIHHPELPATERQASLQHVQSTLLTLQERLMA